jgi:uncharacterized membrane protein YvlD (DUF360 family)
MVPLIRITVRLLASILSGPILILTRGQFTFVPNAPTLWRNSALSAIPSLVFRNPTHGRP